MLGFLSLKIAFGVSFYYHSYYAYCCVNKSDVTVRKMLKPKLQSVVQTDEDKLGDAFLLDI